MKWLLGIIAFIAVVIGLVAAIGAALPKSHTASRSAELTAPPETVWAIVTDPAHYTTWRRDLTKVEVDPGSVLRWTEYSGSDRIKYQGEAAEPPSHFVARIADPALPFGGSWDYRIEPTPAGSRITITENGEVYNPIFRFVSRFVMGHTATIDKYLRDLAARTGDSYKP